MRDKYLYMSQEWFALHFPLIVVVVVTSVAMYSRMFIVPTVTQMQKLSMQLKVTTCTM